MIDEANYVTIIITSTSVNAKQNEEEVDLFAKQIEKLALHTLSYSSTEIVIKKHRRVVQTSLKKE